MNARSPQDLSLLLFFPSGGMQIEDFEAVEQQIHSEMKQNSLDVDVGHQPLSRTPSLRSTNVASEGRDSSQDGRTSSQDGK